MQEGVRFKIMITDRKLYDRLTAAFGNPYAAVIYISKLARELSKTVDYDILDSQALSWAITGVKPQPVKIPTSAKLAIKLPIAEVLQLVDDEEVKDAVLESLRHSVSNYLCSTNNTLYNSDKVTSYSEYFMSRFILNNELDMRWLIFCYNDVQDEPRQSRIRILTRLIWDKYEY